MLSRMIVVLCSFMALLFLAVTVDVADAARVGGGRSFGGKSFMNRSTTAPSSVTKPQATQQQAGAMGAQATQRQGLFGGMGGMLGGLLAGSLLGSLLFGGGFGGGGFMDILIIGGLLYLLFKFLARRRAASAAAAGSAGVGGNATMSAPGGPYAYQSGPSPGTASGGNIGGMGWDALSSGSQPAASAVDNGPSVPEGFDQQEFLEGAKAAYVRLNASWDKRDIDDIGRFATPAFMTEIRAQAADDPTPSRTEIMLVNASLAEVRQEGDEQLASVFFSVLLREESGQSAPVDVREMWHFVRNVDGSGQWRIDGIQQVS